MVRARGGTLEIRGFKPMWFSRQRCPDLGPAPAALPIELTPGRATRAVWCPAAHSKCGVAVTSVLTRIWLAETQWCLCASSWFVLPRTLVAGTSPVICEDLGGPLTPWQPGGAAKTASLVGPVE